MLRNYKYKLDLRVLDREVVEQTLTICRNLYNGCLEQRKFIYKQTKAQGLPNPVNFYSQKKELPELKKQNPEYAFANAAVLQDVVHRVDKAYQNFFRRWKSGLGKGFPRFKFHNQFNSFTHPQGDKCDFDWQNSLVRFPGLGWLRFWPDRHAAKQAAKGALTRATPEELVAQGAKVKTVTIVREPDDFYVCFAIEIPDTLKVPKSILSQVRDINSLKAVGIDMGLKDLVVTDTGLVLGTLKELKKAEKKIRLTQRELSRKKKGSNRRSKQRDVLRKQHSRLASTKKQELHKISKHLVDNFDVVCVEDLNIKGMLSKEENKTKPAKSTVMSKAAKRGMRRNIGLAAWGELIRQIDYKAESAGKFIVKVDPKGTTQQCSGCGGFPPSPLGLSVRVYSCTHCGMIKSRDENAGMNIKQRGLKALEAQINQTGCISPTLQKGRNGYATKSSDTTPSIKQCEAVEVSLGNQLKSCM